MAILTGWVFVWYLGQGEPHITPDLTKLQCYDLLLWDRPNEAGKEITKQCVSPKGYACTYETRDTATEE